jgi:hypothetical protein
MNLDNLVNTYGVFALILIYVVVNLAYKNLLNLIIFIVVLLATMGIFDNKINAVILAYIISILYGIVKNFHLLENFNTKTNSNTNSIITQEESEESEVSQESAEVSQESAEVSQESSIELNINESTNIIKKTDLEEQKIPDMDLISSKLIKSFVKKLKTIDESNIYYKKLDIDSLNPTLKNLNKNKLESVTSEIRGGNIPEKVYVSKDNFILEGHYVWFSLKNLSNSNDAKYGDTIDVILIDMPIKKIIKTLDEFKIDYNKEQYDKFALDAEKMNNAEKSIKNIKVHIKKLEDFHNNLKKVILI